MVKDYLKALRDTDMPLVALHMQGNEADAGLPVHRHRKGQLVMPESGYVTCRIHEGLWMVPAGSALWIPGGVPHTNHVSSEGSCYVLLVEPDVTAMPEVGHTLSLTPLLREMIIYLAEGSHASGEGASAQGSINERLSAILVDLLPTMPREEFYFPTPHEPRLQKIATALMKDPADRRTVASWATDFGMSERTLARLVHQHVGVTFGQWRSQLRIIIALQQLSMGVAVQVVAENLGYESCSAFITFFKKVSGKSPRRYMRTVQREREKAGVIEL
ncbi:AraC family transcriptional regulator [Rhodobacteraceae bacterium RKSG542]|uniref:helix-turn-helix domain-containing protein n=1 Tax=Pseudovibrio flavus TaxID=2529854 RepID=UPI0012BB4B57|nr:helix-turn-helix transcriptional regulator [Pseudovibrio flavus]MTI15985.1 AraC family transcriptional regulator [Pseudovibrio flavus]